MSESKFDKAVAIIQALPKDGPVKPGVEDQLHFYKYFKQANGPLAKLGDNDTTRPGLFDFSGKAKWDAWESVKGVPKEEAWEKYVAKLIEILKATGDDESKKLIEEIESA